MDKLEAFLDLFENELDIIDVEPNLTANAIIRAFRRARSKYEKEVTRHERQIEDDIASSRNPLGQE